MNMLKVHKQGKVDLSRPKVVLFIQCCSNQDWHAENWDEDCICGDTKAMQNNQQSQAIIQLWGASLNMRT